MNLPPFFTGNPFTKIPYAGDHLNFGPLAIEYKIDEDFANYFEIYNWLEGLGFPETYAQYAKLDTESNKLIGEGLRSDISLMILNAVKETNLEIVFHDALPTSISSLVFNTTDPDVDYLSCMVTFDYTFYKILTEGF